MLLVMLAAIATSTASAGVDPGVPGAHFGDGGVVLGPEHGFGGGSADRFRGVALDREGRIVAAGYTRDRTGADHALIVRYRADGTLDPTFGDRGVVVQRFLDRDQLHALAIDAQGRIVVAGKTSFAPQKWKTLLARFLRNGAIDPTFGDATCRSLRIIQGIPSPEPNAAGCTIGQGAQHAKLPFSGSAFEGAHPDEHFESVAIAASGRICAAGAASELSRAWFEGPYFMRAPWFYRALVACFDPKGTLETTPRVLRTEPAWTAAHDELNAITADGDDGFIAAGWAAGDLAYRAERSLLFRTARGGDEPVLGPEHSAAGGTKEVFYDVVRTRDQQPLGIGFSFDAANNVRVLLSKPGDPSFGDHGTVIEARGALAGAGVEYAVSGALDSKDRIWIAGFTSTLDAERDSVDHPILARYDAAGRRDTALALPPAVARADHTGFFELAVDGADRVYAAGTSRGRTLIYRHVE